MNLADSMREDYEADDKARAEHRAKFGEYVDIGCPNCTRHRVMLGEDKKRRCEKCCWCLEDSNYDYAMLDRSR